MGNGVHISQKSKVRRHKQKAGQEVTLVSGRYVHDFVIVLTFSTNGSKSAKLVDFLPLFQKYVKGDNLKYFAPVNFKKFIIKNNTLYWGKNEDVIFPLDTFLSPNSNKDGNGEVLYVI